MSEAVWNGKEPGSPVVPGPLSVRDVSTRPSLLIQPKEINVTSSKDSLKQLSRKSTWAQGPRERTLIYSVNNRGVPEKLRNQVNWFPNDRELELIFFISDLELMALAILAQEAATQLLWYR